LTITSVGTPGHGTVIAQGGDILYTPAAEYFGPDTFTYTIGDGHGGTATAAVNVTVGAVEDAPSLAAGPDQAPNPNDLPHIVSGWAGNISAGPANEFEQAVGFVVANDNHALFSVQPSVSPGGTLTFRPSGAVLTRMDAFVTVTAVDDGGTANGGLDASAPQTFRITVTRNQPPTAVDDSATLTQDAFATIAVLANDSDPDNPNNPPNPDVLTVTGATIPSHGSAVVNANNTITYTPQSGYFGGDSFTYTIDDGHSGTATATVHLTVNSLNQAPVATDDRYVARENTPLVSNATCAPVSYATFASVPGLTLNGTAAATGGVLRLVAADTFQVGSAFTSAPRSISAFHTSFSFRMSGNGSLAGPNGFDGQGAGADGLVFVLQNAS